jgi:hypothetical protein
MIVQTVSVYTFLAVIDPMPSTEPQNDSKNSHSN